MNSMDIGKQFLEVQSKYEKLGQNIVQALELFLSNNDISYLSISHRVKDKQSFIEKIKRKSYEKPFEQIEDICGVRIICYYQNDVNRISEIIKTEFDILENQDKENLLNADQFGYRSTHFIVRVKKKWLQAPNYRGLEDMKVEIQLRTVLMHAWAEIEHKLAYKSEKQVPKDLKRKLSRISAKLEEADEQFEELKHSITSYKNEVAKLLQTDTPLEAEIDLNLDSLQSFLDVNFPNRYKSISDTSELLDELLNYNISLGEINTAYDQTKEILREIEKELFGEYVTTSTGWAQVGVIRTVLDLNHKTYFKRMRINERTPVFVKWIKKVNIHATKY